MISRPIALLSFILCAVASLPVRALAALPENHAGRFSAQLAAESDDLIRCAIRRPYGWAWNRDTASEATGHPSTRPVSMELLGTPAAGLVLLWAGQLLNQPRYIEAAKQVARGVTAAQTPIGRIRSDPVFGPAAGGRDELVAVADRSATTGALGFLLATIDTPRSTTSPSDAPADSPPDPHTEAIRRAAARCAHWLARQQAPNGLWPSAFPSGPPTPKTIRLVRLDAPDYRDSTFALLLSFDLLRDDVLHHPSILPLDALLKLRLVSDVHGPGLWCTACTVNGTDIPTGFPNGPDILASRFTMQTLLGGYLLTGDRSLAAALNAAATTLGQVKRADGQYDRLLDPTAAADVARSLGDDVPSTQSFFSHPTSRGAENHSVLADPAMSGSFGIPELLDAAARLQSTGPDRYADAYNAATANQFSLHQQIQACLCGLIDDPLTFDFPATADAVPAYLSAHADLWKPADGPAPDDLSSRVRRIWILFLRARLERLSGA